MPKLSNLSGTAEARFQIGIGGSGTRTLRFRNTNSSDLTWNATANRSIALPDASGTVLLSGDIGVTVQGYDADLAAIAALTTTSYGRSFNTLADAAAARLYVGFGRPILQSTTVIDSTARSTTSATYTSTGISATLANNYEKSSNEIRVRFTALVGASASVSVRFQALRGATTLTPTTGDCFMAANPPSSTGYVPMSFEFIDLPGTTTRETYTITWLVGGGATAFLGRRAADTAILVPSSLTLEEISI